jgi:carbon-monoxide dehydrogenase medium subunit
MRYEAPETLDAAVTLLNGEAGQARPLAGGTDLLVQLRSGMVEPDLVVDLKRIPALRQIAAVDGGFRVGAAVSGAELGEHAGLKAAWPGVVEAAELIGSTQIQGRASLGGNLCNASPAADSVPAMIAAAASVTVLGSEGEREVPVEDIVTGPGQTSLARDEIVVAVNLPPRPARSGDAYLRFIPRTEMDIAVVGAGVSLTLGEDGLCSHARVALGAVAATPLLVPEAAEALIGTSVDEDALARLAEAASIKVAGVMARRAAEIALDRARSR